MSGGSFDYLCYAEVPQQHSQIGRMADELRRLDVPFAREAAHATRVMATHVPLGGERLRGVWRAVEWWRSDDCGRERVEEALREYGAELTEVTRRKLGPTVLRLEALNRQHAHVTVFDEGASAGRLVLARATWDSLPYD